MSDWQSSGATRGSLRAASRRVWRLTLGELRLLTRYGILALYGLLSFIYIALLLWVAPASRPLAGGVIILTDPAAMGLFFMGAMVLLEKSQRVNCSLAVSPVRAEEYIAAKAITLMAVGLAVALGVGAVAGMRLPGVALSVVLGSVLFTLLGMIVACVSDSLNRFLIYTIPFELLTFVPALFFWYGGLRSPLWVLNPGVAAIALLGADAGLWPWAAASLLAWDAGIFALCRRVVRGYFAKLGGGKL